MATAKQIADQIQWDKMGRYKQWIYWAMVVLDFSDAAEIGHGIFAVEDVPWCSSFFAKFFTLVMALL